MQGGVGELEQIPKGVGKKDVRGLSACTSRSEL